jgi:putative transposase
LWVSTFYILFSGRHSILIMTCIRQYFKGGTLYFLTHVTHARMPILVANFNLLWRAIQSTREKHPFDMIAWVVLPDHMHLLIDPMQCDLSGVIRKIKLAFSANYREQTRLTNGRVWQNRFWDHHIRDQNDFNLRRRSHFKRDFPTEHSAVRKSAKAD